MLHDAGPFPLREIRFAGSVALRTTMPTARMRFQPLFIGIILKIGISFPALVRSLHMGIAASISELKRKIAVTPRRINRQTLHTKSMTIDAKRVKLTQERCLALRKLAHELSNVTTGMLMAAGLLRQLLAGDERRRYCEQINEAGERTAALVREVHALLHGER
jgi:signal transduction histidine kinase